MSLFFVLLITPFFSDACHVVKSIDNISLQSREGEKVYNPAKSSTPQEKSQVQKVRTARPGKQKLMAKVLFSYNSSAVSSDSQDLLMHTAQEMGKKKYKQILIQGFADASGRSKYNKVLSKKRALAVKKWLTEWGFPSEKITIDAIGENTVRDTRVARRVEIRVVQ